MTTLSKEERKVLRTRLRSGGEAGPGTVLRMLDALEAAEAQAEIDRLEIQAYGELLDDLAKAFGAENYVEAVGCAKRAEAKLAEAREQLVYWWATRHAPARRRRL